MDSIVTYRFRSPSSGQCNQGSHDLRDVVPVSLQRSFREGEVVTSHWLCRQVVKETCHIYVCLDKRNSIFFYDLRE